VNLLAQTVGAIKDALKLADDVRRAGDALRELAHEVRDHDRRIARLGGAVGDGYPTVAEAIGVNRSRPSTGVRG
jgi:hypothetical protein